MRYEEARSMFSYADGVLYWAVSPSHNVFIGDIAGTKLKNGYIQIRVFKKLYKAHHIIYLLHHKIWPKMIDHIDGNRSNNRVENLRVVSYSENNLNRPVHRRSQTGIKNVHFCKAANKYKVNITINKKLKYIGSFDDIELAELVATEARDKFHGAFACHR